MGMGKGGQGEGNAWREVLPEGLDSGGAVEGRVGNLASGSRSCLSESGAGARGSPSLGFRIVELQGGAGDNPGDERGEKEA
jgi:hypothetical protein